MCPPKARGALAHRATDWQGVIRMLRDHAREQPGHPPLHRVWKCIHQCACTQDRRMSLLHCQPERDALSVHRQVRCGNETNESVLECENAASGREAEDARQSARRHFSDFDYVVIEAVAYDVEKLDNFEITDQRHLSEVEDL